MIICGLIFGLLVLAYPLLPGMAQKGQGQKNPEQEKALQVVRQNVIANIFYDTLQAQESDWTLTKADYFGGGEAITERGIERDPYGVNLVLKKDESEAQVLIYEYASEDDAKLRPKTLVSAGRYEECKGVECGDEGEKIYGQYSKGLSWEFRKGRFFVSIYADSEETAKRFAGYALTAITGK